MKRTALLLITVVMLLGNGVAKAQDAATLLKKMDDVIYAPKDQKVKLKIIIYDKNGKQKIRKADSKQMGSDYRLMRFTEPASQRGIAFLSLPNDIMYVYLPAFKKERRIAGHVKTQNFAGTDFSYEDLESKPYSEKYNPVSAKTTKDAYVLEVKPKDKNSAYSKLIITMFKNNYYPKKVEYYDKKGRLSKVMTNKKVEKIGKYWTSTDFIMENIAKKTKTEMIFENITFDNGFTKDDFSVRKLVQ
jgi:outer membrane lipoprotein-sorting protein